MEQPEESFLALSVSRVYKREGTEVQYEVMKYRFLI
jgi:hypothetical protein